MESKQIQSTMDYSIFKLLGFNRKIRLAHVKRLEESLRTKNMLSSNPILVNENMEVIDGQHRLKAAMNLSLEVFYCVLKNSEAHDIILLNSVKESWSTADYVNYHANQGNLNYLKFQRFAEKSGVALEVLKSAVFGSSTKINHEFKQGKILFGEKEETEVVVRIHQMNQIVEAIQRMSLIKTQSCFKSGKLRVAIIDFLRIEEVDFEKFFEKFHKRFDLFRPCITRPQYIDLFKAIYNHRNPNPIP